jgi:hypothetical protein
MNRFMLIGRVGIIHFIAILLTVKT